MSAQEEDKACLSADRAGYVVVTDAVSSDGCGDVSDELQKLIDENPNRTIYFPDGVYVISKPILTPAEPTKSVDLQLSNYAVIRAASDWAADEAMIRLGGKDAANDIETPGSLYSFTGGIVDGSGRADGISVDGGRETVIKNVSVKNTRVGITVKRGANSGSSDVDVRDVNIVGTGREDSVGVLVIGMDNTFTNMRIANVCIGFRLQSSGNFLKNIHPLFYLSSAGYEKSYGFYDEWGDNWYDNCYSDQLRCGFCTVGNSSNVYNNCFCFWYSGRGDKEIVFSAKEQFNSIVNNIKIGFNDNCSKKIILEVGRPGGSGAIDTILVNPSHLTDWEHEKYFSGRLIPSYMG